MKTYITAITWVWIVFSSLASFVSVLSIGSTLKDRDIAKEANGLRYRLARSHVRREVLRFMAYTMAAPLGIMAWTPVPKRYPVQYSIAVSTVLVLMVVTLATNTFLDYKLRRDMHKGGE